MKKKIISVISAFAIAASGVFTGCTSESKPDNGRPSIVTTCFPPYDFARAVTGDSADITMLLCPGAEAHSYEPTPMDILKIQQCDVFIYVGGTGEVWAEEILKSAGSDNMTVIRLMDYTELLEEGEVAGASPGGHDHSHEHHHDDEDDDSGEHNEEHTGHYDEHIWTSLKNAALCTEGISEALCGAFPGNREAYEKNASDYIKGLEELDGEFTEMTENAKEELIIVGDRFPFRYLAHDYDLEYFAAFSGCSSESEPGVYTMAFLIDEILEHQTDTIFYLEFSTKRLAQKLCDATGAEMLPLHSCHNVSPEDFASGVTYLDLMRQNMNNLKEALY